MSVELILYGIDLINNIRDAAPPFMLIGIIFLVVICIGFPFFIDMFEEDKELKNKCQPYVKPLLITTIIVSILSLALPSKLTLYSMVGVNYLKKTDLPEKVSILINKKIDELIKEK